MTINISKTAKVYIHATDTCYGFAARWNDQEAIQMIQELKGREEQKAMSLLFSSLEQAKEFCKISEEQEVFIQSQTEASSFIVQKKEVLKDYFPDFDTICIRIENDNFPVKLASLLETPVTSTSVNKSGEAPLYNAKEIRHIFDTEDERIELVDSGSIPQVTPSTIWNLTTDTYTKIR